MLVKMTDKVRHEGKILTLDEMDQRGLLEFVKYDNYYSNRTASGKVTKYFANVKGTDSGWEISKTNYLVRTGQKDKIGKAEKLITVEGIEITKNAINSFNLKIIPSANDNWNKAKNQGTLAENRYLRTVAHYYGVDKLTAEDIRRYIEREKINIV